MVMEKTTMEEKKYNAIDLFSGCGGLSLGLSNAGFNILYANEINKDASNTYKLNLVKNRKHNTFVDVRNISTVMTNDIKKAVGKNKIHLVAGGPPCQGFSMAGKRDINDQRNKLFKELFRVVKEINPPLFLMENVKGILSMQGGKVIKTIQQSFESLGYEVKIEILKASAFGVPQNRERVFIIGTRIGNGVLHPTPDTKKPVTVEEAISDLSFLNAGESSIKYIFPAKSDYQRLMRRNNLNLNNHESSKHNPQVVQRFSLLKEGQTAKDLPNEYKTRKMILTRLCSDKPAKTVTTLPDDYIHYNKDRILTVREMARLQSFPDDFVFIGPRTTGGSRRKKDIPQYSQIGNAVPPLLAEKVGKHLIKCLQIHKDRLK